MKRTLVHSCDATIGPAVVRVLKAQLRAAGIDWISMHQLMEELYPDFPPRDYTMVMRHEAVAALLDVHPNRRLFFTCLHAMNAIATYTDSDLATRNFDAGTPCTGLRIICPADLLEPTILQAILAEARGD